MSAQDDGPVFDIPSDSYYLGMWFLRGKGQDWMALAYRAAGADKFTVAFRFRYYVTPGGVFDGKDTKHAYEITLDPSLTEEQAIAAVDILAADVVRNGFIGSRLPWKVRERSTRTIVRGDGKAMMRAIAGLPFVHISRNPTPSTPPDLTKPGD